MLDVAINRKARTARGRLLWVRRRVSCLVSTATSDASGLALPLPPDSAPARHHCVPVLLSQPVSQSEPETQHPDRRGPRLLLRSLPQAHRLSSVPSVSGTLARRWPLSSQPRPLTPSHEHAQLCCPQPGSLVGAPSSSLLSRPRRPTGPQVVCSAASGGRGCLPRVPTVSERFYPQARLLTPPWLNMGSESEGPTGSGRQTPWTLPRSGERHRRRCF